MTMGDGEILPEDLIFEILLQLPVTSLIRFKCVSKRWKEIISSPEFSYLHYSKISSDGYLVDIMATVSQDVAGLLHPYRLTLDTKTICNQMELQQVYQPPHIRRLNCSEDKSSKYNREILLGPCWGLYCKLSIRGDKFAIWNPATREAKVAPLPFAPRDDSIYPIGYGFGASTKNEPANPPSDFKFVRFSYNSAVDKKVLEVYSSRNKSWHSVEASVGPCCGPIYRGIQGVELNQVVHWYVRSLDMLTPAFIFTFNLADETCGTINLPHQVVSDRMIARAYSLSTMDNQYLSLIVVPESMDMDYADIWIMRQHSIWTKHTRVDLKGQVPRVLGYWNNADGGLVFGQDDRSESVGYFYHNYIDGENLVLFINDDVQCKVPLAEVGILTVANYAESLISPHWPS